MSLLSFAVSALIAAQISNVSAEPVDKVVSKQSQNEEAKSALKTIADLAITPETRDIAKLAEKMQFSYQLSECHPTDEFSDFCQYQIINRDPTSTKILILALGHDRLTGRTGGRLVWNAMPYETCLSQENAVSFFGQGDSRISNIPDSMAGVTSPIAETKEYVYRSIPGGTPSSSAIISYRNNCIHQIFLDF